MRRNLCISTLVAAALACSLPAHGAIGDILFSEDFNDGGAAGRWSIVGQTEGVVGPDWVVDLAYDYVANLGIPAAPNGGGLGAAFGMNLNDDGAVDEGESVSAYPTTSLNLSNNFSLRADMFVWNDEAAGSTEFGMFGGYLDNASPVSPYEWGSDGGPIALIYSGEGGASRDLAWFPEGGPGVTGYTSINDYNLMAVDAIPGFQTGVASSRGPAPDPPTPRGTWVDVEMRAVGSTIDFYLNGALIESYDNSGGFYTVGNIFVGGADPFNSSNPANRTVVDNIRVVEVPEPATMVLLGLGGLAGLLRRRR